MITTVFVYGTLKRGQCRESHWPVTPRSIQPGWTRGALFGRPAYPAMTAGPDRVLGELWSFEADQVAGVLNVLDQIEGANQAGQVDLYHRVVTAVSADDESSLGEAWTYHYASDPRSDGFHRILPERTGYVKWPAADC
jgi:gamma-glutamylcyclotransferase (GGCT)/AIG2-like uncharacterized protein YtfP